MEKVGHESNFLNTEQSDAKLIHSSVPLPGLKDMLVLKEKQESSGTLNNIKED